MDTGMAWAGHGNPAGLNIGNNRILRLGAVLDRTGLGRSTLYSMVKTGHFPPQVSLGLRAVGWLEADVEAWIRQRVQGSFPS